MCSGAQPRTHTIRQGRRQRGTGTRCSLHRLFPVSASKSHFTHSPTGLHKTLNAWAERQPSTIGGVVPYPHAAPSKYSHKQDSNTIQHPSDCPKDHSTTLFPNELHNEAPNCLVNFPSQICSTFRSFVLFTTTSCPLALHTPLGTNLALFALYQSASHSENVAVGGVGGANSSPAVVPISSQKVHLMHLCEGVHPSQPGYPGPSVGSL